MEPIGWARRYLRRSPARDGHAHFAPFDRALPSLTLGVGRRRPPPRQAVRPPIRHDPAQLDWALVAKTAPGH